MYALYFQDPNLINVNNFEECSLCPTVSIEHGFLRQHSKSNDEEETEIHWKLIPITGKDWYTRYRFAFFYLGTGFLVSFIFSSFLSWVTRYLSYLALPRVFTFSDILFITITILD